jgi:hypothetical protein
MTTSTPRRTVDQTPAGPVQPGRPSSPVAAAGTPAGGAPPHGASPAGPDLCRCGHGVGLHDIRTNKSRGACLFMTGPGGVRCECTNYGTGEPG